MEGITARVPYLKALGVDAVWLSPFYRFSQFILKKRLRKKEREPARRRSDIIAFDESKFKRTTKLLEALRGKNISHPTEAGEGGYDPLKE